MADETGNAAVLAALQKMSDGFNARMDGIERDLVQAGANQEKFRNELNALAGGAAIGANAIGGPSAAMLTQQLEALRQEIDVKVEGIDAKVTRDREAIKKRHAAALKRAGEMERSTGVHMMWHPKLDSAQREGLLLCRLVRTQADKMEAEALGYLDTLDQAAQALFKAEADRAAAERQEFERAVKAGQPAKAAVPARFATWQAAKVALHTAEQRVAKQQVAARPAAPVQQGAAA